MDWHEVKEALSIQFSVSHEGKSSKITLTKIYWWTRTLTASLQLNTPKNSSSMLTSCCSRSEGNSLGPTCFGIRANTQGRKTFARKTDMKNQQEHSCLAPVSYRIRWGPSHKTLNHVLANVSNVDKFIEGLILGASVATMLRRIPDRGQELADIAQAELTSQLHQKFFDSLKKQPT